MVGITKINWRRCRDNPSIRLSTRHNPFLQEFTMSTTATVSSAPLGLRQAAPASVRPATAPRSFKARGLAALLLAGVVAAMVLVADHLVSTWADGHLFLAWVMLWVIVFAGFALFADTARTVARRTLAGLDQWAAARAQVRAEERLWDIARADPRVMAELVQARSRSEEAESVAVIAAPVVSAAPAAPLVVEAAESVWEKIGRQRAARALAYRI
jgi:hypothetical protein